MTTLRMFLFTAAAVGAIALRAQIPVTYTIVQANAGKTAYGQSCANCHGVSLDDGEFAPPLNGPGFLQKYGGKPPSELFTSMTAKMPPGNPGALGGPTYAQIMAYVLQQNGVEPGATDLPSDSSQLALVSIGAGVGGRGGRGGRGGGPGGGLTPGVKLPPAPAMANPLDKFTSVTDAMLQNPPPSDWLTWRRSFDYQGYSPLKQINKSNVKQLRVAWSWALPPGGNEATPLVHDGVMFVHGFGDKLWALNAATATSCGSTRARCRKAPSPASSATSRFTETRSTWALPMCTWWPSMPRPAD